ncbi:hypothetical protein [Halomarina rubra]|uniref:ECF transporter S component n=1 Tax=Halomarina rubra TaxID=2071873 RepID=A0ABD6AXQ3_9EURY|nr:hypothetical protein [Halomarina rubra]
MDARRPPNARRSPVRSDRDAWSLVAVAAATALLGTVVGALVGVPSFPTALAPTLGIALGPVGVWGVLAGSLLRTLAAGTPTVAGLLAPLTDGLVAYLAFRAWGRRRMVTSTDWPGLGDVATLALVGGTTVAFGTALRTWLGTLLAGQSATALVPVALSWQVLPATLLALPAALVLARSEGVGFVRASRPVGVGTPRLLAASVLSGGWLGAMFTQAVLWRDVVSLPHAGEQLAARLPTAVAGPVSLAVGPRAALVHVAVGVATLAVLAAIVRGGRAPTPRGWGISESSAEHVFEDEIIET